MICTIPSLRPIAALRGEGEATPDREILLALALLEARRDDSGGGGGGPVDLLRLGLEPAVALGPQEDGADPAGDPGVGGLGREEGLVRERQLQQLQLDLPLLPPSPPRACAPPAAVALGAAAAGAALLADALLVRAPRAEGAAGRAQGARETEQVGRRVFRAADDDDGDGAGPLVGRLRRIEGRCWETAASEALCAAQAVLPWKSEVGYLYSQF